MRIFKCDNCSREVEGKRLINTPMYELQYNPQDLNLTADEVKPVLHNVDLCSTCFRLYAEKSNGLYVNFTRQLK